MQPPTPKSATRLGARHDDQKVFYCACILAFVILLIDSALPLGIAGGVLYVAVVFMGRWFSSIRQIVWVALLSAALTVVGYFTLPEGGVFWAVLTNRFLALFAIAASAAILIAGKKATAGRTKSETLFSQVLDNAVSGVISIDHRGIIQSFNRAAEMIFGHAPDEVIGHNVKMLMPEFFAAHHDSFISNYIKTGDAKIIGIGRQVEGRKKDGSVFPMDLAISELSGGEHPLFTGTVTDISDRKKWEEDLLTAKKTAEKANKAKSEFLSSMSHELRTPLNAILGFTQLLNTDPDHPLTEKQIDATEQVLKAGDHLLSLIDEVLDLAAIESGKVPLDAEPHDPTPVLENCAVIADTLAAQKGLTFYDRTTGWRLPEINIDDTRFQQVLLNLLSNAVKYNRDGGTVTLSVGDGEAGAGSIRFSVADSGRGIAADKQARIFTPFSRLGLENSDITGTGIGLSITRKLTEAMGGAIGFESTLNLGSTFWLEFPVISGALSRKNAGEMAVADADTTAAAKDIPPRLTAHTVLCIEDNPSSLKLMESVISRIPGAIMISAHTGELGVDLAEIHQPDVILMDINLPGISGFKALSRLQASEATKDIPVIALTALASSKDKKHGLDLGFKHYLTKPINIAEVTSALTQALANG